MTILVMLKNQVYYDDGLLVCENVQDYGIDRERGFLVIDFGDENYNCVNLDEIIYFKILNKG